MARHGRGAMQIKWENIKPALVRKVGSGGFAQVYEVYMYGALMAVKIVNLKADQDLNLSEALVRFKCLSILTPSLYTCLCSHVDSGMLAVCISYKSECASLPCDMGKAQPTSSMQWCPLHDGICSDSRSTAVQAE